MKKTKVIGGLSFGSEDAYNNFLSLSKEEQIKQVAASYSPVDESRAEKDLKGIANGDSSTTKQEVKSDNVTSDTGANGESNTAKSGENKTGKGK